MQAKDLMRGEVFTVDETALVEDLTTSLIQEHVHGAPVIDPEGRLVGVVSQQDVFFASMTLVRPEFEQGKGAGSKPPKMTVGEIMTSPAVSVDEDTDAIALCRMMHKLRIHRVPVLRQGKVVGLISSLDICGAVGRGEDLTGPSKP
ncbi:MAG: CBS domain-containing protein [bacterium]|nr:CBS domain-containing protein [bacterium]